MPHQHPHENEHVLTVCWLSIASLYCKFCFQFFFLTYWLENLLVEKLYSSPFTYVYNCHLLLLIAFFKNLRSYTPLCNSTFLCSFYICPCSEENFLCPEARGSSLSLPSLKKLSFYSSINLSLFFFAINIFLSAKMARYLSFCGISKSKRQDRVQPFLFLAEKENYVFKNYVFIYLAVLGLSCSMWICFPDQRSNPGRLHYEHKILATGPPGKYEESL